MIEIGCQGWNYEDWVNEAASGRAIFYPHGTRAANMLEVYARAFTTVEVDSTFYATPTVSTFENWARRATPDDFTFALKLPRDVTHNLALRGDDARAVVNEFCERARALREKLAAILIQLPPQFERAPENTRALAEFVRDLPEGFRFAVEFRQNDWLTDGIVDLLARHKVAVALVEGQWLRREKVLELAARFAAAPATDFAYIRFMGARDLTRFDCVQRPQDENLKTWSEAIRQLAAATPRVYAYFSNFYEGHAPTSANKLKRLLEQKIIEPDELENQPSLF